ncbi:hypothetical protein E5083_16650 [Streptomyces bauhiniae]|uniref:Uncharacterized protein n=1 Tax=Streptomyces bauhiniae TaxID=2340725 RepID=A0A4Z1D505_9ACTN|nr:hypothetical protein [Streptomyces bauhiniae]TGN76801.1 hypothetical protein E5083_16650 [Streptomyces bauhiniae]
MRKVEVVGESNALGVSGCLPVCDGSPDRCHRSLPRWPIDTPLMSRTARFAACDGRDLSGGLEAFRVALDRDFDGGNLLVVPFLKP